eukprot:s67_g1.t4
MRILLLEAPFGAIMPPCAKNMLLCKYLEAAEERGDQICWAVPHKHGCLRDSLPLLPDNRNWKTSAYVAGILMQEHIRERRASNLIICGPPEICEYLEKSYAIGGAYEAEAKSMAYVQVVGKESDLPAEVSFCKDERNSRLFVQESRRWWFGRRQYQRRHRRCRYQPARYRAVITTTTTIIIIICMIVIFYVLVAGAVVRPKAPPKAAMPVLGPSERQLEKDKVWSSAIFKTGSKQLAEECRDGQMPVATRLEKKEAPQPDDHVALQQKKDIPGLPPSGNIGDIIKGAEVSSDAAGAIAEARSVLTLQDIPGLPPSGNIGDIIKGAEDASDKTIAGEQVNEGLDALSVEVSSDAAGAIAEVVYNNPQGSDILLPKEQRAEEFYIVPSRAGKKGKTKKQGHLAAKVRTTEPPENMPKQPTA